MMHNVFAFPLFVQAFIAEYTRKKRGGKSGVLAPGRLVRCILLHIIEHIKISEVVALRFAACGGHLRNDN